MHSIAGTSTILDALIDTSYYAMQSTLKMSGFLIPFNDILPLHVIQKLIEVLSARGPFSPTEFLDVMDDVRQSRDAYKKANGWSHVVVGHSLGGAYANVIAARVGVQSFSLSPPGLYLGTRKMGIQSIADLSSHVISVVPEGDLVPTTDGHAGTIAHIPCTVRGTDAIAKAVRCHSSSRTLAMLALACPDKSYPQRRWEIVDYPNAGAGKRHVLLEADGGAISRESTVTAPHGWAVGQ